MKKISLIFMITIVPMILRAQTANVDVATPTATAGNITSTSTGVGIGTTTPQEILDVVGNTSVSGELKLYRVDGNGTPTDDSVRLKAYTGGALMIKPENGATYIRSEDTNASNILLISGSYSKGEYGKFSHNRMVFSGNIDSDGNGTYDQGKVFVAIKRDDDSFIDNGHGFCIGRRYITPGYVFDVNGNSLISGKLAVNEIEIGTTTTSTDDYVFKCHGKIGTKSIQVRQDENWPDYVFDEEYDLMKLDSLQQFVKTEKHLPGVETATEIETNGLDLGAMQTTQMQKIEELTLYLLQLNEKLQEQDKSVQQLQEKVETLQNENASLKQSLQKNK